MLQAFRNAAVALVVHGLLWSAEVQAAAPRHDVGAIEQPAAAAAALTIAQATGSLESLARQLEQSARSLIEQGNMVLAQQQMTLAGALRALIKQVETAYADSLKKTEDTFTTAEKNVRDDVLAINAGLQDSLKLGSQELQARIYQTQTSANQLLDKALPWANKSPLLYGFQTRDILGAFDAAAPDVEVLGYLLADPELQYRKPEVYVEGQAVPSNNVTVSEGRVQIRLPESLKASIRLANQPCNPIRPFAIWMRSYYLDQSGILGGFRKLVGSYSTADLSAQVSPGARAYQISVALEGTRSEDVARDHSFGVPTSQVNFGCGESRSAMATWTAPDGASQLNITSCGWRNQANAKSFAATPAIGGLTATCSGSITGLDNNRGPFNVDLGCPGGGHGEVFMAGTYKLNEHIASPFSHKNSATLIDTEVSFSVPVETGLQWQSLRVEMRRRECGDLLDEATIEMPGNPNERKQQTSRNGLFQITWQQSTLTVTGTPRLAGM